MQPASDIPPVTTSSPGGLVAATYLSALRRARDLNLDQAANAAGLSGFELHCLDEDSSSGAAMTRPELTAWC